MAMFDYKNYSSDESKKLADDANRLSVYTNASSLLGFIPADNVLNGLGKITGELFPNNTNIGIPQGWRELTPSDFGLSNDLLDKSGYFKIESLYTGTAVEGPQAKIFGQYDETGKLERINLNIAGTNDLPDILDYLNLNSHAGKELYEPILKIVKDYAINNGLTGSNVLISGYSLGAGVTNVIAAERKGLADGFFTDSDYMAFAVPAIYDNPDVVLNYGYENDVVHRVAGNAPDFFTAIADADPGLVNPDKNYASSMDNVVLFNDVYASPIWNLSIFSLINIPTGWYAHINGVTTDAITRISNSTFYNYTQKDSTFIVADLTALSRSTTWVQDYNTHTSSHYNTSAFLVGSKYDDLIAGGSNFDYIDAGAGNDTIRAGNGVDHVDGNIGIDQLRVEGRSQDWNVYQMQDDTLFFVDKNGYNLVEADNVESVSFKSELMSHGCNYIIGDTALENTQPIRKWFSAFDVKYSDHVEGSDHNDTLTGRIVFGREGNDSIKGTTLSDTLHGGSGDDIIMGLAGNDKLYGAEGNDILDGGAGADTLIGGIGNDIFKINALSGGDVIVDFNNDVGYHDIIQFSSALFSDIAHLSARTTQVGDDVSIGLGGLNYLTVENCYVNDVLNCSIIA
ncbi:calcium-binding protein [Psychrobacter sp.]|uniref:calcium-binding protein n=1 Tax=Psychrobacter sp. TaxID=56811 RepID=UPI0025D57813|nr:calcium-binding protein [Psychrobacter sp.]